MYGPYSEGTQGYPYRQPGWASSQPGWAAGQPFGSPGQPSGSPGQQSEARQLRIGTADRQRAIDLLRDHTTAGRLELDEFEERVATAHTARTGADLDALFTDLPSLNKPPAAAPIPVPDMAHNAAPVQGWKVDVRWALLIIFLIGLLASSFYTSFQLFPLMIAAFCFTRFVILGRRHRHNHQHGNHGRYGYYQNF